MTHDDKSGHEPHQPKAGRSRFNFSNTRFGPPTETGSHPETPRNTERDLRRATRQSNRTYAVKDKNGPLVFNVAQLLRSPEGTTRAYDIAADQLVLDEETGNTATNIQGHVRLTRVRNEVLAQGPVEADATVNCVRCLNDFQTHVEFELEDIFRPTIDVVTGLPVGPDEGMEEDEELPIDENHLLDLGEAIRQQILVNLPMYPHCGDNCPGLYSYLDKMNSEGAPEESEQGEEEETPEAVDRRWSALKNFHPEE